MSYIVICRLNQIAESAVLHGAREMVSLLAENQDFHRPGVIDEARHLKLGLNDIAEARPGLTAPGEIHVDRLIRFAQGWDQRAPLVVHLLAGDFPVTRSRGHHGTDTRTRPGRDGIGRTAAHRLPLHHPQSAADRDR